jgi:hypothetical protein
MENSVNKSGKKVVGETKLGVDGITRIWTDKGEGKFGWRRVRGTKSTATPQLKKVKKEKVVQNPQEDPNLGKFKVPFKGIIVVKFDEVSGKYYFSGKTKKGDHWSGSDVSKKRIEDLLSGSKRLPLVVVDYSEEEE